MRSCLFTFPIVALTAAASAAGAQDWPQRKPGLWEVQMTSTAANVPSLEGSLEKLPPEKRARMEQFMRQQGLSGGGANTIGLQYCLTPEEVAKEAASGVMPRTERGAECQNKSIARTASEWRFAAVCRAKDGEVSEWEGRVYDVTPERYAAELKTTTAKRGVVTMRQTARWLKGDCGDVK